MTDGRIRRCRDHERAAIVAIVNAAAEAYRGVIPADRWHEPYMPLHELDAEIAAGVAFWGYEAAGALVAIMGIQPVGDVDLIRHAYVSPASQRHGVGGALLARLVASTTGASSWAPGPPPTGRSASTGATGSSWSRPSVRLSCSRPTGRIPARQVETSVVLANPPLDEASGAAYLIPTTIESGPTRCST